MPRVLVLALALLAALAPAPALAAEAAVRIAVVDFQRAINEVKDGAAARQRLEALYQQKQQEIARLEEQLRQMQDEYQKQAVILSEEARKQKEGEIMQAQMAYQQAYMRSQDEMQKQYASVMDDLIGRLREVAEQIGRERGFTLVLEATEGGVVYADDAIDITDELIRRFDARAGAGN